MSSNHRATSWLKTGALSVVLFVLFFLLGCSLPGLLGLKLPDALQQMTGAGVALGKPVNILLLGIDARPGEENARTDTMILAHIDPEKKKVALVSIPRDTKVTIRGQVEKINAANVIGGPEEACRAVEDLMNCNVDYYALTNFSGFARAVDILGGVTIDVEKRMYKPSEGINLYPGVQRLNGKNALAYVRWRGDALGDISRTERQQKFIMAFAKELFQSKTILKLPALVPELKKNVKTNMGLGEMLALARMAAEFKPENLVAQTLPGYFYNDPETGASYWIVDKARAETLLADLMEGRKVAVVEESPEGLAPTHGKKREAKQVAKEAASEAKTGASSYGEVTPGVEEPGPVPVEGIETAPGGQSTVPNFEPAPPAESPSPGSALPENPPSVGQPVQNQPSTPSSPVGPWQPAG